MICEVCGENQAKYKCPACGCQTCCLACVKKHKIDRNCSGQKPKSEFIPVKDMNEHTLYKDIQLLDQASIAKLNAADKLEKSNKPPRYLQKIKKECSQRGIDIKFMPNQATRRQENKTYLTQDGKNLMWTTKWRFFNDRQEKKFEMILPPIQDDTNLASALKAIIDASQDDFVAHLNLKDLAVLMVAEGLENGQFFDLSLDFDLNTNLTAKTIIEYPIFHVVPKDHLSDYKLADPFALCQFKEEKVEEVKENVEEEVLPDYEKIKSALKLDLIKNVMKQVDEGN